MRAARLGERTKQFKKTPAFREALIFQGHPIRCLRTFKMPENGISGQQLTKQIAETLLLWFLL